MLDPQTAWETQAARDALLALEATAATVRTALETTMAPPGALARFAQQLAVVTASLRGWHAHLRDSRRPAAARKEVTDGDA